MFFILLKYVERPLMDATVCILRTDHCLVIILLSVDEKPGSSSVAGGEQQNQTQLKPKRYSATGRYRAQQEVLMFTLL